MTNTIEGYTAYAKGEIIDDAVYPYVRDVLENFASGELKEKIVTNVLGYKQSSESIHGEDAFNNDRPVEIKCETATPLCGAAAWTSTNTSTKLQKLLESDQEFVLAGWSKKGRLVYILSCNLNDTDVIVKIEETINRHRIRTSNLTPKTTHTQLGDADVKLLYFNEKYVDETDISKPFLNKLKNYG